MSSPPPSPLPPPFAEPVWVTRPILPPLAAFTERLREVWDAGWLTNFGSQHQQLEARLREQLGVPHLALVNNATIGLLLACRALGLRGEVITTPFTFPASVHALDWAGLEPVFCDLDPATLGLDARLLPALVTPRTSAILAVHVYGVPCDVAAIDAFARERGLRVIYDAAHAFDVRIDGRGIGSFGDVTAFSFHATKLFHTAEGGALACGDPALAARLGLLRNFGIADEESVPASGVNGKLSELHAALGLLVLDGLAEERAARARVARRYHEGLAGTPLVLPAREHHEGGGLHYFVVRVPAGRCACSRDELQRWLRRFRVMARKYFHPLCSDLPPYAALPSAQAARLPVAQATAAEVLCLPLHGRVSEADADAIAALVRHAVVAGVPR